MLKGDRVIQLLLRSVGLVSVLVVGGWALASAAAQPEPGAICVTTFADTNGNGIQDTGETALAGMNVNLITGGAIIATHIMAEGEESYCFENLLRGEYTVRFTDAPTHRFTTPREGTFTLDEGERLVINPVGAVPVPIQQVRAEFAARSAEQDAAQPLDSGTRLLLATVGSMLVMLFMVGLGVVLVGLFSFRTGKTPRQSPVPPPQEITPPR